MSAQPIPIFPRLVREIFAIAETFTGPLASGIAPKFPAPNDTAGRLPIIGILGPARSWAVQTSYESVRARLRSLLADSSVQSIQLFVDSPGGDVAGLLETADSIFQANRIKPITAIVPPGGLMASAAYWLGSQAGTIIVSPSSQVGSVGVMDLLVSTHRALDAAGIDAELVTSAQNKGERSGIAPISGAARAHATEQVRRVHDEFVAAIRRGRGARIPASSDFGSGRLLHSGDALRAGLVDFVRTLEGM
jgi:ClpP class serine protease